MPEKTDWKYFITPAFIAREIEGKVEIRNFLTDEWTHIDDPSILRTLSEDGSIVSEEKALETYQHYKKTLT